MKYYYYIRADYNKINAKFILGAKYINLLFYTYYSSIHQYGRLY